MDNKMITKLKKILKSNLITNKLFVFLRHIKNKEFMPYTLRSEIIPSSNYSDFFVYNKSFHETIFVAENTYSLLLKKRIKVNHIFKFYNDNGIYIDTFKFKSDDYIANILLPRIKSQGKYISFTHHIDIRGRRELFDNLFKKNIISLQHRGYTIYKKTSNSMGSKVHGNFGAINPKNKILSAAIQRKNLFLYTPAYKFKKNDTYDLVFNNPTKHNLQFSIFLNDLLCKKEPSFKIIIPSFGCYELNIKSFDGIISFLSRLPVGRCIIFKNSELSKQNFDIFHA